MILALIFLPVILVIVTIGLPFAFFLVAVAATIRYGISVAYCDCAYSWKLLTETPNFYEEPKAAASLRKRVSSSLSRSLAVPTTGIGNDR